MNSYKDILDLFIEIGKNSTKRLHFGVILSQHFYKQNLLMKDLIDYRLTVIYNIDKIIIDFKNGSILYIMPQTENNLRGMKFDFIAYDCDIKDKEYLEQIQFSAITGFPPKSFFYFN